MCAQLVWILILTGMNCMDRTPSHDSLNALAADGDEIDVLLGVTPIDGEERGGVVGFALRNAMR